MPKPTFLQLPADKRDRFVDAALDEFSAQPYDRASVSAVVARLGIAKGSVYQYFEDKLDLFTWLLDEAGRRKQAAIAARTPAPGEAAPAELIHDLRSAYLAGFAFWRTEPRWARLGLRLLEPSQEPRLELLRRRAADASHRWLRERLAAAIVAGELRPDVDPDDAAHLVGGLLSEGLLRAWLGRAGLDLADLTDHPERVAELTESDLIRAADQALALLSGGLARR